MFPKIKDIIEADTDDLRTLAEKAEADPEVFYQGANLMGVDVSGQDLRGISFRGCKLGGMTFDENTISDKEVEKYMAMRLEWNLEIRKDKIEVLKEICRRDDISDAVDEIASTIIKEIINRYEQVNLKSVPPPRKRRSRIRSERAQKTQQKLNISHNINLCNFKKLTKIAEEDKKESVHAFLNIQLANEFRNIDWDKYLQSAVGVG